MPYTSYEQNLQFSGFQYVHHAVHPSPQSIPEHVLLSERSSAPCSLLPPTSLLPWPWVTPCLLISGHSVQMESSHRMRSLLHLACFQGSFVFLHKLGLHFLSWQMRLHCTEVPQFVYIEQVPNIWVIPPVSFCE